MTATKTEPPVCSYPIKDYWRVYTLEIGADPKACNRECPDCNFTNTMCSASPGGHRKVKLPAAVRGMIPAESRDWLLSSSSAMQKSIWQVLAGCECDPEFVSKMISAAWAAEDQPNRRPMLFWTTFRGLCHNVHMDRATQLRFAHDVLFCNRKVLTGADQIRQAMGFFWALRSDDVPAKVLQRRSIRGLFDGILWGALSHPDVLTAVLAPDGSGFGPGISDEVRTCAEVLEPFDRMLDCWKPGLPERLPMAFRLSLMHSDFSEGRLLLELLLTGDHMAPVPVHALQGVLDLVHAARRIQSRHSPLPDPMVEQMRQRLLSTMTSLELLSGDRGFACGSRQLEQKLALRKGQGGMAAERLVVASKSWGKVSLGDKKKWIEIPVTADPSWTRQEPPHA